MLCVCFEVMVGVVVFVVCGNNGLCGWRWWCRLGGERWIMVVVVDGGDGESDGGSRVI